MTKIEKKVNHVKELLHNKKVLVAFSGGVDSSVCLWLAKEFCSRVLAVTVKTIFSPPGEIEDAECIAREFGVDWKLITIQQDESSNLMTNPPNRCYFCKKGIMSALNDILKEENLEYILDGTNFDDLKDYRPGMQALREYNVQSPLADALITKTEIREIARVNNLKASDKPSMACLASRIPYGEKITEKKLKMIAEAEAQIKTITGITNVRVRLHQLIARIEVAPKDRVKLFNSTVLDEVARTLKKLGFVYITLDMEGYRSGSMNEPLQHKT